ARVDVGEADAAIDLDRRRGLQGGRGQVVVLDQHVLALRDLPALDQLLDVDVLLAERAEALLLDGGAALAVEGAEGDLVPRLRVLLRAAGVETPAEGEEPQLDVALLRLAIEAPGRLICPSVECSCLNPLGRATCEACGADLFPMPRYRARRKERLA